MKFTDDFGHIGSGYFLETEEQFVCLGGPLSAQVGEVLQHCRPGLSCTHTDMHGHTIKCVHMVRECVIYVQVSARQAPTA